MATLISNADRPATTPGRPGLHRDTTILVGTTFLALLPVVALLLTRTGRHYLPLGDEATIDLRVRDVFTSNTPLVGPYSRGFSHPGPLLYWLLAPLSAVSGGAAWATLVGGGVLQGVAIAASGWLAFRRGGLLLALGVLAALGLAYSSFALGNQFLQPWNPNIAFPFFMLFLLQVWSIAIGSRWQLLGAALTATLLVQLHVSYLPLVAVPVAWAAVVVVSDRRRGRGAVVDGPLPRWRTVFIATAASLVALWVVVAAQQLTQSPGNLGAIARYFRDAHSSLGIVAGARFFAAEFRVPPPWLGGTDKFAFITENVEPASVVWLLVPVVLLGVGFYAARSSGRVADRRMLELATVTAVTSIVAISRVNVDAQAFLFYWRVIAALFVVLATAWAIGNWVALDERRAPRALCAAVLVVVVAVLFGARMLDDVLDHPDALLPRYEYAQSFFDDVKRVGLPREPVLLRGLGSTTDGLAQGLVDELDREGAPVRVDPEFGYQYGAGRTATTSEVSEVWYLSADGSSRSILDEYPDARVVAYRSSLSDAKEHELRELQRSMTAQLTEAGRPDLAKYLGSAFFSLVIRDPHIAGVDTRMAKRISDLNDEVGRGGGCRCIVIAFPANEVPDLPFSMGF